MYRYFVLIWNPADAVAVSTASSLTERLGLTPSGWTRAYEVPGVVALHAGHGAGASRTLCLHQDAGAVFGRIFNRDMASTEAALRVELDGQESSRIVHSGGRHLLERYWGRYVALVRDAATGETWVLRDPSGGMPCWLMSYQGVHLVFSDLADCLALGLPGFTVNWSYIGALVANAGLQLRATALREVSEIQLGERVRFSRGSEQRSLEWDPIAIARSQPLSDPDRAVAELRETVRGCVQAWAACYDGILHNLSGGLDSSIVLGCLRAAPRAPPVTCLHYYGTGPCEDERSFARSMADLAGAPLIEHELDPAEAKLERLLALRKSPRPWFYMYELEHGSLESSLAAQHGADGLFSGAGGDGVFFQANAALAVTDYTFDHGIGRDLLRVAVDAAQVSRKSIWPLLLGALRARLFGVARNPMTFIERPRQTLVHRDLLESARRDPSLMHPWFANATTRGVPPGVLWHVLTVSCAPAYYNAFADSPCPERTLPLLSQPLVELCLRIPTYLLIRDGIDRALARRAFASDLPQAIARRRTKGRIDQHVRNIMDRNLDFVRERLLDGRLVSEGILNREVLQVYLERRHGPADFQYAEILQLHLCIEAWLSSWLG